jgi:hypothetical protein
MTSTVRWILVQIQALQITSCGASGKSSNLPDIQLHYGGAWCRETHYLIVLLERLIDIMAVMRLGKGITYSNHSQNFITT